MTRELSILAFWAFDLAARAGRVVFWAMLQVFVIVELAAIGAQFLAQAFAAMGMVP